MKHIEYYLLYMENIDKNGIRLLKIAKKLFSKNINNLSKLSQLIDKYLIPQELEKKNNAEISTPRKLRQEMLDKMPLEFWIKQNKVFEPCCGKGGFIIDIIEKFVSYNLIT